MLTIHKNRLPHWRIEGSYYAVTCHLRDGTLTEVERDLILETVKKGHKTMYNLIAIQIMNNHVHLILQPIRGFSLSKIMKNIKGATAREINLRRGVQGSLWMKDSYDRIIRNENELLEQVKYIYQNPLRAGIVERPELYKWWYAPDYENGD